MQWLWSINRLFKCNLQMRERERGRGEIIHRKDFIILNFFFFFKAKIIIVSGVRVRVSKS